MKLLSLLLVAWLSLAARAAPPAPEKELAARLKSDLEHLSVERNYVNLKELNDSANWLEGQLKAAGYQVDRHTYKAGKSTFVNLETRTPAGKPTIVVGAHYDSVHGSPGANDNGTGVVATLALARLLKGQNAKHPVRFVLFTNEEPPFFQKDSMGSLVYARHCHKRGDKILAMLSLETIGYYSDEPGSQRFPDPQMLKKYGDRGNFLAFVGDDSSAPLIKKVQAIWKVKSKFPSQTLTAPASLPGISWSDHWSFWQVGYPAVMITDTAPYRYPYYHTEADTPDKVSFGSLARVVLGLKAVVQEL